MKSRISKNMGAPAAFTALLALGMIVTSQLGRADSDNAKDNSDESKIKIANWWA